MHPNTRTLPASPCQTQKKNIVEECVALVTMMMMMMIMIRTRRLSHVPIWLNRSINKLLPIGFSYRNYTAASNIQNDACRVRFGTEKDVSFIARMQCYAMDKYLEHAFRISKNWDLVQKQFEIMVSDPKTLVSYRNSWVITLKDENMKEIPVAAMSGFSYDEQQSDNRKKYTDRMYMKMAWNIIKQKPLLGLKGAYFFIVEEYLRGSEFPIEFHPKEYYLAFGAVENGYRGRSFGTMLLKFGERIAMEKNCERIRLDVAEYNKEARRLYERLGYREVKQHGVKGELRVIHMMKTLN